MIRRSGHEAEHVLDLNLVGDGPILKRAKELGYVILTGDSDFKQEIERIMATDGRLPGGLVMVRGETRKEQRMRGDSIEHAIKTMLKWVDGMPHDGLKYLDVMIDRSGICYKAWERMEGVYQVVHEDRQVYNLDEKLEYYGRKAAIEVYRRDGKDAKPEVNYVSILDEHRNLLREDLDYIKGRMELATKAGVNVSSFNSLSDVIFKNDYLFVHWIREAAKDKRVLETEEFKLIAARVDSLKQRSGRS